MAEKQRSRSSWTGAQPPVKPDSRLPQQTTPLPRRQGLKPSTAAIAKKAGRRPGHLRRAGMVAATTAMPPLLRRSGRRTRERRSASSRRRGGRPFCASEYSWKSTRFKRTPWTSCRLRGGSSHVCGDRLMGACVSGLCLRVCEFPIFVRYGIATKM